MQFIGFLCTQMREYWQSTFNVDPTKPSIGAVNLNEVSHLLPSYHFAFARIFFSLEKVPFLRICEGKASR